MGTLIRLNAALDWIDCNDLLADVGCDHGYLAIEALKKGVLSNEEIYTSLLNTIQKRKIHLLPNNLKNILTSQYINISSDFTNLAGFISYYGSIYDKVKSTLESTGKNTKN